MPSRHPAQLRGSSPAVSRHVLTSFVLTLLASASLHAQITDVPVTVAEALPADVSGLNRLREPVTFGLPFPPGAVPLVGDRPALRVQGSDIAQFRSLRLWPDGSVQWALVDTQVDLINGAPVTPISVQTTGSGMQGGAELAVDLGTSLLVETGAMRLDVPRQLVNDLVTVTLNDGEDELIGSIALVARATNGELLRPGGEQSVEIEENGPARSVVRIDTELVRGSGESLIDVTLRFTTWRDSTEVDAQLTVRNARFTRAAHAQLESVELEARITDLGEPFARVASHNGHRSDTLTGNQRLSMFMGYTSAATFHTDSKDYRPHLPRVPGSFHKFSIEGYATLSEDLGTFTSENRHVYPNHGWLDLAGEVGGVTVAIKDMPHFWPAALEATSQGIARAGLFTRLNGAPYTFVWRQHESRQARFAFRLNSFLTAPAALAVARRLDAPTVGRASDYDWYDNSKAFFYDLLTIEEHNRAYELLGIDHEVETKNPKLAIMRYLGKTTTGSANNHAQVEDRLGAKWLRHGLGGQYLKGLDVALWKSEWQVPRSDNFHDIEDPGPSNDELPHTQRTFGDEEHRYRDGMMLAYHLTGDERLREALFDEAEVLEDIEIYPQERAMWQTLRAQALVTWFTGSVPLRQVFLARLTSLLPKSVDVDFEDGGWGWQGPPGSGSRRYYVFSGDLNSEKPPGENFQTRGFVPVSLGPLALYNARVVVGPGSPFSEALRSRLRDIAYWTRFELFPYHPIAEERRLPYSYAVSLQQVVSYENFDFHPILFGMAEAWHETGQAGYLVKGLEQIEAFEAHDEGQFSSNLHLLDTRLDCQHFMSAVLEVLDP